MTNIRKTLITLSLITTIAIIAILIFTYNRTYYNNEEHDGNFIGNIYNSGLFCEINNKIYFSNIYDDNTLYVVTSDLHKPIKIYENKVAYINGDKNYIYFTKIGNSKNSKSKVLLPFKNNGQFRINLNGSNIKSISNKPGAYLSLKGNYLYYQAYDVDKGVSFFRKKIDGSDERLLFNQAIIPAKIDPSSLLYIDKSKDYKIHSLNLNSFTENIYLDGDYMYPIIDENFIYYISPKDNYTIWKKSLITNEATLLVSLRCSTYNISLDRKHLYYQIDNEKDNSINVLDLTSLESNKILDGDYKQINVTKNYVFFNDFLSKNTYVLSSNGSSDAVKFLPLLETPVIEDK